MKKCPECGNELEPTEDGKLLCSSCQETYVQPTVTMREFQPGTNSAERRLSDIAAKQLERIVEQEQCSIVVLWPGDGAVVYRNGETQQDTTMETLLPQGTLTGSEDEPAELSWPAKYVLLTTTLFQSTELYQRATEVLHTVFDLTRDLTSQGEDDAD